MACRARRKSWDGGVWSEAKLGTRWEAELKRVRGRPAGIHGRTDGIHGRTSRWIQRFERHAQSAPSAVEVVSIQGGEARSQRLHRGGNVSDGGGDDSDGGNGSDGSGGGGGGVDGHLEQGDVLGLRLALDERRGHGRAWLDH
eukprot:4897994-Pleurochrysis_carterae.AAC.1